MANNQQPTHRVYTVIKREGQDDFWLAIGAVFAHADGKGFNVMLQALPIPDKDGQCKIVLRQPTQGDEQPEPDNARRRNSRSR